MFRSFLALLSLTVFALALGIGAVACEDHPLGPGADDDENETLEPAPPVAETSNLTQMGLVMATLGRARFHDTEDSIADGEIPDDARFTVLRMEALIRATNWPDELESDALALADVMNTAAEAYDAGDVEAALEHAEAVHDSEHDFSGAVWAFLGEETGVDGLGADHDDGGDASPTAEESESEESE